VRFLTLTDNSTGDMDFQKLYSSWQKLTLRLKRRNLLGEFAYSLELQPKRKALHIHCLMAEAKRGGGYIDTHELSDLAVASGFGQIVKINLVESVGGVGTNLAAYLRPDRPKLEAVNEVARYCSKVQAIELASKAGHRIRPFRTSRQWPGGGLRDAEAQLMEAWYGPRPKTDTKWEYWHESECQEQLRRVQMINRTIEATYNGLFAKAA